MYFFNPQFTLCTGSYQQDAWIKNSGNLGPRIIISVLDLNVGQNHVWLVNVMPFPQCETPTSCDSHGEIPIPVVKSHGEIPFKHMKSPVHPQFVSMDWFKTISKFSHQFSGAFPVKIFPNKPIQ